MTFTDRLQSELDQLKRDGLYKRLNYIASPQGPRVRMEGRGEVVILSSNNYLGLCNEPDVIGAGKRALDEFGAGTGSVRFICGPLPATGSSRRRWPGSSAAPQPSPTPAAGTRTRVSPQPCGEQDIVISDS